MRRMNVRNKFVYEYMYCTVIRNKQKEWQRVIKPEKKVMEFQLQCQINLKAYEDDDPGLSIWMTAQGLSG